VLFNLAQIRHPHENFKHYFDFENNGINFDEFPLLWPEEKLKLIENTFMENTLFDMNLTLGEYSALLQRSSYFPKYSMEDLKKAFILMNSQNFKIKIDGNIFIVIIPFMDIYKMDPNTNVDWSSEIIDRSKGLILKAVSDISKGSPLITNYGDSDNANLLLNYGFTLKKNNFPIETEFFNFRNNEINYNLRLNMLDTKDIFDIFYQIKTENSLKLKEKNFNKVKVNIEKDLEKQEDIKIFELILKNLLKYSNKKRLENLSDTIMLNKDKKLKDILRALNAEDQLIEKNIKNILEIIHLLKSKGELKSLIKDNNKIYLENKKYFDKILSYNNNNNKNNDNNKKEKKEIKNKKKIKENMKSKSNEIKQENIRNIVITYNNSF
jgi:hypothetical protein